MPGSFFAQTLREYEYAVRRYQIRQIKAGNILFRIAKARRFSDDTLDEIKRLIRHHLGSGLQIDVEFVDEANLESSLTGPVVD